MARILGVDIPGEKRIDIALRYIYGIGPVNSKEILSKAQIDPALRAKELNEQQLSQIVHAEIDGRQLRETELLGIAHLLLLGGLDTVTATLDCMLVYLATHPDRRQMLVDDPGRITPAIEELLRWETPVMIVPRKIKQDMELGGVALKEGDGVKVTLRFTGDVLKTVTVPVKKRDSAQEEGSSGR